MKSEEFKIEKINVENKFSSHVVGCALQDKQGFIWFGTAGGLCRYDGYNFKIYETIQNFSSRLDLHVTSCFEDSNGIIWFGTLRGSILEYNLKKDCLFKHELNITEGLPRKMIYINSICEDANGYLWLSVYGRGLYKFDKSSKISNPIHYDEDCNSEISDFIIDLDMNENKELIIALKHRIDTLNVSNGSFQSVSINTVNVDTELYRFCRIRSNRYFLGTNTGLKIIDLKSNEIIDYQVSSIKDKDDRAISIDKNENLWVVIYNEGLVCIDLNTEHHQSFSVNSENHQKIFKDVSYIFNDRSGIMWICTFGNGIFKVDISSSSFHFINKENEIVKDLESVRELKTDSDNNIWAVSSLDHIIKFDSGRETFKKYYLEDKDGTIVNSRNRRKILENIGDQIWIGTADEGLFRYEREKDALMRYSNLKEHGCIIINAISEYHDGEKHYLLLGTNKPGIACIDLENEVVSELRDLHILEPKIREDLVSRLFLDSEENLWVYLKHQGGLFKLSVRNSISEYYPLLQTKHVHIYKIYEDSFNNLWFCTSEGLFRLAKDNKLISQFTRSNGLPSNTIFSILEDDKKVLWVVADNAISKFDPNNEEFKNYDFNNKITNTVLLGACCKDENGILYFGGFGGIDYFNPNEIKDNTFIPNIVITDFQINNQSIIPSPENTILSEIINYAKQINLTYKENIFTFEFAALIFNNPKQNQYAYMMEGFDKDWVYCGTRRTATYTNLDPGDYIFRVKGSNNDGIWNEEGTSIKIKITPPFWKTWWFKGLGAMSVAAAGGLTYKNRLDKIENEKKAQEEFSRKLIESQENERKRIASELHDTIAHDVLIAKNKADIGLKHSGEKERVEETLREISEMASATIKDVRNISYNLHPHQLERLGFTKTIKSIVKEVNNATDIDFSFESDEVDAHLSKESEINLFRVIQESINNMIKHSEADKAEVKLLVSDDYILVILKDNGKGISPDKKDLRDSKGGFGLSGMKERIKYMKGEIHIESEENKGTSIVIRIPVNR